MISENEVFDWVCFKCHAGDKKTQENCRNGGWCDSLKNQIEIGKELGLIKKSHLEKAKELRDRINHVAYLDELQNISHDMAEKYEAHIRELEGKEWIN